MMLYEGEGVVHGFSTQKLKGLCGTACVALEALVVSLC